MVPKKIWAFTLRKEIFVPYKQRHDHAIYTRCGLFRYSFMGWANGIY